MSGALIWQIGNAQKTVNDLQDADHNIATATYILALIGDEESGVRGFQNTSNEAFLQSFENAHGPLAANVTNSVAQWPGYVGVVAGARHELPGQGRRLALTSTHAAAKSPAATETAGASRMAGA